MFIDFVLASKNKDIEDLSKRLGFSEVIFKEDFKSYSLVIAKDYAFNRNLVESKKVKILVDLHVNTFKDNLHFRVGGLDQVLCKLCNKNDVTVGFSLSSLKNPVLIGRVKQNIKLCRKYKVKMRFFSFAENKFDLRGLEDMKSLLRVLGMTGKEAKDALSG
ncbi:hypothetical protein J4216_01480 [Candidatus Woesearchaeota archaeon]|nr:hypothetical protein [Candidatus Woesearchaeota archaeon]